MMSEAFDRFRSLDARSGHGSLVLTADGNGNYISPTATRMFPTCRTTVLQEVFELWL